MAVYSTRFRRTAEGAVCSMWVVVTVIWARFSRDEDFLLLELSALEASPIGFLPAWNSLWQISNRASRNFLTSSILCFAPIFSSTFATLAHFFLRFPACSALTAASWHLCPTAAISGSGEMCCWAAFLRTTKDCSIAPICAFTRWTDGESCLQAPVFVFPASNPQLCLSACSSHHRRRILSLFARRRVYSTD